jgi:hypothetical protein
MRTAERVEDVARFMVARGLGNRRSCAGRKAHVVACNITNYAAERACPRAHAGAGLDAGSRTAADGRFPSRPPLDALWTCGAYYGVGADGYTTYGVVGPGPSGQLFERRCGVPFH